MARVVLDLARAQHAAGLLVTVACPGGELAARAGDLGIGVREWRATRSPGPALLGEVRGIGRLLGEVRPDLVHAHSAKAGLAGRLAVRGRIPTVFQPHAWSFEAVDGPTSALALRWERWAARWADRVLCVSEAERERGVLAGVRAHWSVVPNGIDPRTFCPSPARPGPPTPPATPHAPNTLDPFDPFDPSDPRGSQGPQDAPDPPDAGNTPPAAVPGAPTGADPGGPLVVCVGRLCRQKGQDVLLRAWRTVVRRVPGARLALVGDGPDRTALAARAPGSVLFTGAVTDVLPWYRAADLVVLPSRWEGMALAPLEAMACGRPVLVTDVDGARESLPSGLAAHCLVPAGDAAHLAEAVVRLLLDPALRTSLGERGRRHVLSTHDVRHTAETVADVYRALLGPSVAVPFERRESIHS